MSDNRLGPLPEDFFDELGNLTFLSLGNNQIRALPEDVFDGLGNLEQLSLQYNQISVLPEDVFDGLGNLERLWLDRNQIGALPEDVFDGLGNLEQLCCENQISVLPEDVFDGLGNLEQLWLDGNQIGALPEDVFDGLGNLEQLSLQYNQISVLPENVFDGLGNLDILLLQNNPGSPFTFTAELEQQGENSVVIRVAQGAPFEMTIGISALGGTLSSSTTKIKAGHTTSKAVSVTPRGDGAVTVSVQSAEFPRAADHSGIQTDLGQPLVLGDAETINTPATGAPTISGTAQVGETLTVDTSGIADADGLTGATFSYQWMSSRDTEIQGATDATYTLVAADVGKTVKVRVSFTDDASNEESLTSAATDTVAPPPNTPATGAPTISGAAQVGQTLAAETSGITDADGLTNVSYSYQWLSSRDTEVQGETGSTYSLQAADAGKTVKVRVTFTDDTGNEETLTSAATAPVAAAVPSAPGPAVAVEFSPSGSVDEGTEIALTMSFANLESDSDTSDTDYIFRADVVNADACEGGGMGFARYMYKVDEDPEVRAGIISASCAPGDYTVEVSISPPGNVELASATADFTVAAPGQQQQPEPPASTDATLSGLTLSGVAFGTFDSATTEYTASVANGVDETTVTPTTNDDGATYVVKLDGVADDDGVISLSVGSNTITIEVTAEDGQAVNIYTVTVTRAGTTAPTDQSKPTAPTISSIAITSSPNDDNIIMVDGEREQVGDWWLYGIDDSIEVTVAFSAAVTVTGIPRLELDVGGSAKAAEYKSTDGNNLKFSYTVAENDEDTDGVSIGANKLTLNGGTIRGAASQDADLSHATLALQSKHKVDGIRPSFRSISFSGSNTHTLNGYYNEGEEVFIKVRFSEGRTYVSGTPQLTIDVGGKEKKAELERTSFGDYFFYTVQEGDLDLDGPSFGANSVSMNGGHIRDGAGNDIKLNHAGASAGLNSKVDAVVPTVSAVAITSDPGADYTYAAGDTVEVSVTFSEEVRVPDVTRSDLPGTRHPVLDLRIGNDTRSAKSGLQELGRDVKFTYTIQSGDTDTDGISINANGLRLNGGIIFDAAGNNPVSAKIHSLTGIPLEAVVPHDGLADDPGHKVAAGASTPNSPATGAPTISGTAQVGQTLTASTSGISDADGLTNVSYRYRWLGDGTKIEGARSSTYTLRSSDVGKVIKVRVTFTDDAGNKERLKSAGTAAVATRLSTDATLSSLALSDLDFGAFDPATTGYTANVANDVTQTTVTPTTNDDGATYEIKLGGVADADGTVSLAVGSNVIAVEVTAEDGETAKTYTVTVTRAAPPSTDATLSGLILSSVDFGAFDSATTEYTASVANDVDETTVTPTTNDDGATYVVKLGGAADNDGVIPLAVGKNVITVEVTAEDGQTTKTYTITVTRAEPPSTDATLSGLELSGIDFGAFNSATTGYTASVANDVTQTTVTPTTNDGGATHAIKLGGVAHADGIIPLAVGGNVITIEVTAEDGNSAKTYTVTVTRAEAPAPEPTVAIALSSDSVEEGTEVTVTMSFANLTPDNDANLVFRADVVGADSCEGQGIGVARNISKVDEDPEIRTGTISSDCPTGNYTMEVSLTDDDVELASARADFSVVEPDPTDEPAPTAPPDVPDKPTGEVTGKGQVRLDWNDVEGATYYQVRFYGNEGWVELPTDDIGLVLDGSGATASNLPDYGFYYFAVRAGNAAGVSEWSDFLTLPNPEQ